MSIINLQLDLDGIDQMADNLRPALQDAAREAAERLSVATFNHLREEVQQELHSTRQKYLDALTIDQDDEGVWLIHLDARALFIEEGLPENFDMLPGLLGSARAKTGRDGSRYLSVPFEHGPGKGSGVQTPAQQSLTATLKAEMARRKIGWAKVETDASGKPRVGMLHTFSVMGAPVKTHVGAGMGRGPIGAVRQGWTGTPFLQNVRVYQKEAKIQGKTVVRRGIMTFRTASSKQIGSDMWKHPGLKPFRGIEKAEKFAMEEWDRVSADLVDGFLRRL